MRLLFLTERLVSGYGVALLVEQLSVELQALGHEVVVGTLEEDEKRRPFQSLIIRPDSALHAAHWIHPDLIVAFTSPFFETLPKLSKRYRCWAWEAGDPTPALFEEEAAQRELIKTRKQSEVYPKIERVVAISEFIRKDIRFPDATVIYCGADHTPDRGTKAQKNRTGPLKVGMLARLGKGEAHYKGMQGLLQLNARARRLELPIQFSLAGKGDPEDARDLRLAGIEVSTNLPESEKWDYLRGLDVFLTLSLWEGFNLPLAEAQALGTLGLALNVGAHAEVTPFTVANLESAMSFLLEVASSERLLIERSDCCYHFVRDRFKWKASAQQFSNLAGASSYDRAPLHRVRLKTIEQYLVFATALESIRSEGILVTLRRSFHFLKKRIFPTLQP